MKIAIIGAGHNGLISAYYLRKRGFDVTVFEGSNKIGGMTDTQIINGVKISRASYVLGLMPKNLVNEFKIPVIEQDPIQTIYLDQPIPFWRDKKKRIEELKKAGEEKFEEFENKIEKFKKLIEDKFTFVTSPPSKEMIIEEAEKIGVEELMKTSAKDFLSKYLSKKLHRFFIYPGMENSPAYLVSYFYADWSFVEGGMGTVADRIAKSAEEIGVNIRTNSKVDKILISNDKVKGIKVNGKEYDSDIVVSATSPAETVKLADLDTKFHLGKNRWVKYNIVFKDSPKVPKELEPFASSIIDCDAGEIVIPSLLDKTLGGNVMEMMGDLDEALSLIKGEVIYEEKITAEDAEKMYILPAGNINHLPMIEPYLFDGRPVKGWGYKSPIDGLYITGAGTYPGGQVTGIPGYNVAMKIIHDLSLKNS